MEMGRGLRSSRGAKLHQQQEGRVFGNSYEEDVDKM